MQKIFPLRGALEIRTVQSADHWQAMADGRYHFSRKATGSPSHFVRQGMRRVHSVAKAHTGQYNGYRYIRAGAGPCACTDSQRMIRFSPPAKSWQRPSL
ncbi:MAG: hypothetical protein R6V33_08770 [Pelovirga sp.]